MPSPSAAGALRLVPLDLDHALDIATWRYPRPYDVYDMVEADPLTLSDPAAGFHAVLWGERLVGFRSFGHDGRVPGGDYDDLALDTGGGLRPELTGQGLGRSVIEAGLAYGRSLFAPAAFRVTVAAFNARALHTVESGGFVRVDSFDSTFDGSRFVVLVKDETTRTHTLR